MDLSLTSFVLEQTLSTDEVGKSVYVAGHFEWDSGKKVAIVKLFLPVPRAEDLKTVEQGECVFNNSMFWKFQAEIRVATPIEIIYPATKAMYLKHLKSPIYLISESASLYTRLIASHISQIPPSNTQWVLNILSGLSEAENVKYRDQDIGFIIAIDYKLQSISKDYFYFLGLPNASWGLKSIRDLRGTHLPLLREMRNKGIQTARELLGLTEHQVLCYVHYYPSFYHFHVHFTPLDGFQGNTLPRAHLLESVISTLESDPDYYSTATLTTYIKESDPFYASIQQEFPSLPPPSVHIPDSIIPRLA